MNAMNIEFRLHFDCNNFICSSSNRKSFYIWLSLLLSFWYVNVTLYWLNQQPDIIDLFYRHSKIVNKPTHTTFVYDTIYFRFWKNVPLSLSSWDQEKYVIRVQENFNVIVFLSLFVCDVLCLVVE